MSSATEARRTHTVLAAVAYLLAAFLFTKIHLRSIPEHPQATLAALASGTAQPPFRARLLVPLLAGQLARMSPLDLRTAYGVVEFVGVALLLVGYRRFLIDLLGPGAATILAPLLLYPMLWNEVGLASQYSPSEVAAVLLFVWGLNCIRSGHTAFLYAVALLACLNRETSLVLALACVAIRPRRARWLMALTTAIGILMVWCCVRGLLVRWCLAEWPRPFDAVQMSQNLQFLGCLVRLEPHVRRHLFMFGGAWLAIPFIWRPLPLYLRRLCLLVVPYGLLALCIARVSHGGNFPELIPVVFTPALLWLKQGISAWGKTAGCRTSWRPRSWHWLIVALLASYCSVRVHERATVEFMDNTRSKLAQGVAPKPFQYRVLVPFIAGQLGVTWGVPLRTSMNGMNTLFVCVLLLAFRAYVRPLVGRAPACALCFLILVPVLSNYSGLNNIYYPADLAAITFFVLGALCIRRGQWRAYYAVFILATLNRETSCFLTFLLLFTQWPRRRKATVVLHCAAQLAIWLGLKLWLAWVFRDNPGAAVFESQLRGNLGNALRLLTLDPTALQYLLTFGLLWLMVPFVWPQLPPLHRRSLLVGVPFLLGMSIVGNLFEVRIYGELIPLVTAPAAVWTHSQIDCPETPLGAPSCSGG